MSDHLPECHVRTYTTDDGMVYEVAGDLCICPALRACEQRIASKYADASALWGDGYEHGLSAARDAVAALWKYVVVQTGPFMIGYYRALAAIDALRGESCEACNGTGSVKCWSPGGPCPAGQTECECCGQCRQCGALRGDA